MHTTARPSRGDGTSRRSAWLLALLLAGALEGCGGNVSHTSDAGPRDAAAEPGNVIHVGDDAGP
ncbi:MAG: hypothetical protein OZ928_21640 [Polyangiaceae bacterium]|nr:hypothetical protein [Polyangiaceae bacterium]